jgi:hypothetical protein
VITVETQSACASVLEFLSDLASEGFLVGASDETAQFLAETTSSFIGTGSNTSSTNVTLVDTAVNGLVSGTISTMVEGQTAVAYATSGVRVAVQYPQLTQLTNSSLSPPQTAAESAYGANQPSLDLPSGGLSACGYSDGYAQLSVMQWGTNPYSNSSEVQSPDV